MKFLLYLLLILAAPLTGFIGLAKLATFEEQALLGTWVLEMPKQSFANGQYRYRAVSFWKENAQQLAYLDFMVYPQAHIRSNMIRGYARLKNTQDNASIRLDMREQIRVYNEGKGFPTPFRVEELGAGAPQTLTIAAQQHSLRLGEQVFDSYRLQWAKAQKELNEELAMDLFMIHTYLLANQLKYFGSPKMSRYRKFQLKGLAGGSALLHFEPRGLIGLGNSGLNFHLKRLEQLAGSTLNGHFFGGAIKMEGSLNLAVGTKKVFEVDFSQIKVHRGHPDKGYYLVQFPGYSPKSIPVSRYGY